MPIAIIEKSGKKYFIELPISEIHVLEAIASFKAGTIVPRIAEEVAKQGVNFSDSSIYKFAERLAKKNLITRETVLVPVIGLTVTKRIIWKANFDTMEKVCTEDKLPD